MKRRTVVVSLVVIAALATAALASASTLNVNTRSVDALGAQPCTRATVSVTGTNNTGANYAAIRIADMPVACAGKAVEFVLFDSSLNPLANGSGTVYSGGAPGSPMPETFSTNVTFKDSDVLGIAVLVDTWGVPASYDGAPPLTPAVSCEPYSNGGNPQPSKTCTASLAFDGGAPYGDGNGGLMWGFTVNVSSTAQSWRLTLDFTHSDYPYNPTWLAQYSQTVSVVGTCTNPVGTVTLEPANGAKWGGYFNFGDTAPPPWWSVGTLCP